MCGGRGAVQVELLSSDFLTVSALSASFSCSLEELYGKASRILQGEDS